MIEVAFYDITLPACNIPIGMQILYPGTTFVNCKQDLSIVSKITMMNGDGVIRLQDYLE